MSVASPPWRDLIVAAEDAGARLLRQDMNTAQFELNVPRPGGPPRLIYLDVVFEDGLFRVRETKPVLLPAFCPELHIESTSLWCLGDTDFDMDLHVADAATAHVWWAKVFEFCRVALRSKFTGVWIGPQSAHGGASHYERHAENAAWRVSVELGRACKASRLSVVESKSRSRRVIKLINEEVVVASGFLIQPGDSSLRTPDEYRLIGRQRECPCPKGGLRNHRALRQCEDHENQFAVLLWALRLKHIEEQKFWDICKQAGHTCCGYMKACPLRR